MGQGNKYPKKQDIESKKKKNNPCSEVNVRNLGMEPENMSKGLSIGELQLQAELMWLNY